MRKAIISAAALALSFGGSAVAAEEQDPTAFAYQLVFRCHAVAVADGRDADASKASNAASKLAKTLGYSSKQFASDAIGYASYYGARHRDRSALAEDRTICRNFGFLA